ncbi:sensor histidine kinase [Bacillus solitudinis]|uniref:sensor histidine kinase n=1 Tax=Bacillus solitudinis TaxID=2014074 RepID=UPI000C237DCE|nr:HAMP domain-containing sensor histidine kinase [Bacillus solitudinis]
MKQFSGLINKKLYYFIMSTIVFLMILGWLVSKSRAVEGELGYFLHFLLVAIISTCLLVYPRYETHILRTTIIVIGSVYFYLIFFLYPETWTNVIFLCLIPALSILFFDSKLFYFSLILNAILITMTYSYIILIDESNLFDHIKLDLVGNMINFVASQLILYFIFFQSFARIKKMKVYYEEIQNSERLKTTGQLSAAVAHEIRNPLTVVKGFLQFYGEDKSFNVEVKRNFSLMIDELNTAEYVISQFLTIAKPGTDKVRETIDVKVVLQSVTDLLKSYGLLYDNEINLNVEENCYIAVNLIEFKQLIINFIKNAIEASKKGDNISVWAKRKKDFIEIEIIDYGCGMSEEEVKNLGAPFYSLKSKGTGLGLMICFNIVEKYHGTIHFNSSKGKGTTIVLRFPFDNKYQHTL